MALLHSLRRPAVASLSCARVIAAVCVLAALFTCSEGRPLDISSFLANGESGLPRIVDGGRNLLAVSASTCVTPSGSSCPSSYPYPSCCSGGSCNAYDHDDKCGTFTCTSSSTVACCPTFNLYYFCPTSVLGGPRGLTTCLAPGGGGRVTCGAGDFQNFQYVGCCDTNDGTCTDVYPNPCSVTCSTSSGSCCDHYFTGSTCPSALPPTTSAPVTSAPVQNRTSAPITPAPTLAPVTPAPTTRAPTPGPTPPAPAPQTGTPPTSPVVNPTQQPDPTSGPGFVPPPPSPPPPSNNNNGGGGGGSNVGAIAGAVGASGVAIALVAGLALFCIIKRKKRSQEALAGKLADGDVPKDAAMFNPYGAPPPSRGGYGLPPGPPPPAPPYAAPVPAFVGGPPSTGGHSTASRLSTPLQGVTSRVFSYEELLAVTNGFNAANVIGQGGFSKVYKGTLADGTPIAVKVMKSDPTNGPDDNTFFSEMAVMSRLRHKYLLAMLGYATAGTERIIVFELCTGGDLYTALHSPNGLDWNKRLRTALDVTIGLEYLHEGVDPPIIHRDVKSANVLFVDESRSFAKLSDFGVARYEEGAGSTATRVLGTRGYVAPEYAQSGQVTKHSDVYSHGVLLGELITGRPCLFQNGTEVVTLRDWMVENKHQPLSMIDPALGQNFHPQQAIGLIQLAIECMNHERPKWRPTMTQVHRRIEELISITAPPPPGRAPPANQPLATTDFNTLNIPVAGVVGPGNTGTSVSSGDSYGPPHSGQSSIVSDSQGFRSAGGTAAGARQANATTLQPFTNIMTGR